MTGFEKRTISPTCYPSKKESSTFYKYQSLYIVYLSEPQKPQKLLDNNNLFKMTKIFFCSALIISFLLLISSCSKNEPVTKNTNVKKAMSIVICHWTLARPKTGCKRGFGFCDFGWGPIMNNDRNKEVEIKKLSENEIKILFRTDVSSLVDDGFFYIDNEAVIIGDQLKEILTQIKLFLNLVNMNTKYKQIQLL